MTHYHLTPESNNRKTGPIPVSTTGDNSCPDTCGLFTTCYAKQGPLGMHFRAVSQGRRGTGFTEFLQAIRSLPVAQLWRHNQAGDLPGCNQKINAKDLRRLVKANAGRRGFTYTHKPMTARNQELVREANAAGFTINLSADNLEQADEYKALGVGPVVTVLPHDVTENLTTPAGHTVCICPATTHDNVTCDSCRLCQWSDRDVIIGFPAHGSRRFQVTEKFVQIQTLEMAA